MVMSIVAMVLGFASLAAAGVHVVVGGRQVARPMRRASFEVVARDTMYVCWHLVSAQLALAGAYLVVLGLAPTAGTATMVRGVATLYLAYAGVFLCVAIASRRRGALLQLGQWIAFLPLGIAGWLATL
jgi:hypothetical protein